MEPDFDVDLEALEPLFREGQQRFHPDRFATHSATERRYSLEHVTRLNEAIRTLRDPLLRAEALLTLSGRSVGSESGGAAPQDPMFLMESMELREQLEEVDISADDAQDRLDHLGRDVQQRISAEMETISTAWKTERESPSDTNLESIAGAIDRMRYHRRFLEEVDRMEEALFEEMG
ncbi:MAG: Fe-S protein assembly co-chaperone HscB [Magnetococcales bacterium]|nr:Fe-S protein assembly co-chaperone HscB [Magnetococcales bacterium]